MRWKVKMAAPRNNQSKNNEACREKIQTTQLINRLQDHALGNIQMEKSQIDAIKILLGKTLPDLSAVSHEGGEQPVKFLIETGVPRD
jgi:hypothetical protein